MGIAACRCWYKSFEHCLNDLGKYCYEEWCLPSSSLPARTGGGGGDDGGSTMAMTMAVVACDGGDDGGGGDGGGCD